MSVAVKIIAIAFIASCFAIVGSRLIDADWSSKPSRQELESGQRKIWVPKNSQTISSEWISKLTFLGYSKSLRSNMDFGMVIEQQERSVIEQGWLPKQKHQQRDHFRGIYCMGNIAQDIEVVPASSDGGTIISAGSYWAVDDGDSRFCRKERS